MVVVYICILNFQHQKLFSVQNFDAEFLKLLVLIDLFIKTWKCNFLRKIICRKKVITIFFKIIFGGTKFFYFKLFFQFEKF